MELSRVARGFIAFVTVALVPVMASANTQVDIVRDSDGTSEKVLSSDLPAYWNENNTYRCELSNGDVWWFTDDANGHGQCRAKHEATGPPRAGKVTYVPEMHAGSGGGYGGFLLAFRFENDPASEHLKLISRRPLSYSDQALMVFVGHDVDQDDPNDVFRNLRRTCYDLIRNAVPPVLQHNRSRAMEACLGNVVLFATDDEDTGRCAAVMRHGSAYGFVRPYYAFSHTTYGGQSYFWAGAPFVHAFGATGEEAASAARKKCEKLPGGASYCQDTVLNVCNS